MPRTSSGGRMRRGRGASSSRKQFVWRKNKRFGQSYAGDRVFRAADPIPFAALPTPLARDAGPLLVEDRPHRDFYFPMTGDEVLARLGRLPAQDLAGLTHIWLRRREPGSWPRFGSYHERGGLRVIVLYPWPRSRCLVIGRTVSEWWRRFARQYDAVIERRGDTFHATFTREQVLRFYRDDLVLHELGHHVDPRSWSPASDRRAEEFAIQYAAAWARRLAGDTDAPPRQLG